MHFRLSPRSLLAIPLLATLLLAAPAANAQTTTCSAPDVLDMTRCSSSDGSSSICSAPDVLGMTRCRQTSGPSYSPPPPSYSSPPQATAGGCQVVDNSPVAKFIPDCGGNVTLLCGDLDLRDYDGSVRHMHAGPCVQPTPTPPPLPAPQVSPNDSYSTSHGVMSSNQMQAELIAVGYPGPFDVPSLLAAYQRTTNSPVRPI